MVLFFKIDIKKIMFYRRKSTFSEPISVWFRGNSSDPFYSLDRREGSTRNDGDFHQRRDGAANGGGGDFHQRRDGAASGGGVHWFSPTLQNRTHFKLLVVSP